MSPRVTVGEVEDLKNHLHSTRQHLEENERNKLSLVEEKGHMERVREDWVIAVCGGVDGGWWVGAGGEGCVWGVWVGGWWVVGGCRR